MKEHPILFSTPMVRAILEGRKTQTRRVMSYQPDEEYTTVYGPEMYTQTLIDRNGEEQPGPEVFGVYGYDWSLKCPYGQPGDRLWVRETWLQDGDIYLYKADFGKGILSDSWNGHWKPSIHMPRKASRLTLEIVNIRAERLQDISEEDARAEGAGWWQPIGKNKTYILDFGMLWNSINSARGYGWDVNPWVWVVEFKRAA